MTKRIYKNGMNFLALGLLVLLIFIFYQSKATATPIREIKVAKHIVKSSGVTKTQMENWIKKANETWKTSFKFVQVGDPDEVDKVGDGKVDGAINIYGSGLTATPPGNPGRAKGWDHIEVGKKAPDDTLAHELGHWLDAIPDKTTTEHGTPKGTYPDHPGYKGLDTDGDGDHDADDRKNVMYPGTARTGTQVDDTQQETAHKAAEKWLKSVKSKATERGKDEPDSIGDAAFDYIDINYDSVWGFGYSDEDYTLNLTMHLEELSFTEPSLLGFFIESDQSIYTGEPLEGLDYFLGFSPFDDTIIFNQFDTEWAALDTSEIGIELAFLEFDAPIDPIAIGFELSLPLSLLERRGVDEIISFRAYAESYGEIDLSPDSGLKDISTQPIPEPSTILLFIILWPWIWICGSQEKKAI